MSTLYFIFLILFLFLVLALKKMNIKIYQIVNFVINTLIFSFLYSIPIICIKIFSIFCNYYDPQLSGYAFAVWYFIIYICVSIARFILLFGIALHGFCKANAKWSLIKKYNLIIFLSIIILDYFIFNFFVQKGFFYNLAQNNVILYGLFYSVTILYLPISIAIIFKYFIEFIKNKTNKNMSDNL